MKLDADGKKRLETMKRTLAAGLPLAGLLAGTVHVASAVVPGQMLGAPLPLDMRRVEPPVERPVEKPAEQSVPAEDPDEEDDSPSRHSPDARPSRVKRWVPRPQSSPP